MGGWGRGSRLNSPMGLLPSIRDVRRCIHVLVCLYSALPVRPRGV